MREVRINFGLSELLRPNKKTDFTFRWSLVSVGTLDYAMGSAKH